MDSTASSLKLYMVMPVLLASIWKLSAEHVTFPDRQSRRIKDQQVIVLKNPDVDIHGGQSRERQLTLIPIVEILIIRSSIHNDVVGVHKTMRPGHMARSTASSINWSIENRIIQLSLVRIRERGWRVGLVIRNLSLCLSHVHVAGIAKGILILGVVLYRRMDQPIVPTLTLHEHASPGVDLHLGDIEIVDVVVGSPQPAVLHIHPAGSMSGMHRHKGSHTVRIDRWLRHAWRLWAVCGLQVGARPPPNPGVHIPIATDSCNGRGKVVFNQNGPRGAALRAQYHVGEFSRAALARPTNLEQCLRMGKTFEMVSGCKDVGIRLANDLRVRRDVECVGDFVAPMVEKEDFGLSRDGQNGFLQSVRVVGSPVPFCTCGSGADERFHR